MIPKTLKPTAITFKVKLNGRLQELLRELIDSENRHTKISIEYKKYFPLNCLTPELHNQLKLAQVLGLVRQRSLKVYAKNRRKTYFREFIYITAVGKVAYTKLLAVSTLSSVKEIQTQIALGIYPENIYVSKGYTYVEIDVAINQRLYYHWCGR